MDAAQPTLRRCAPWLRHPACKGRYVPLLTTVAEMEPTRELLDALDAALDEVARQLVDEMPLEQLLDPREDLGWSFDGPDKWNLYVEGIRGASSPTLLLIRLTAYANQGLLRRQLERTRDVGV